MRVRNEILFFLGILIPGILVFRAFFLPGPLAWGDAPHFYPESLVELVSEPYAWVSRGNNFGGINNFLWLYPLMLFYGFLHTFLGLGNDLIVRIVFYFPATLLAFATPVIFARYLGYPKIVWFFASIFYGLNTYFLLLVDGGQVGVALAYGIFPLALLFLKKLFDSPGLNSLYVAVAFLFLLFLADIRIAVISVFSMFFWLLAEGFARRRIELSKLRWVIPLAIATASISSYWLLPLIKLKESFSFSASLIQLTTILNGLFLFQPHWPLNEFGKVSPPPFYFVGIPLFIFGSILFRKRVKSLPLVFCFLVFTFLVKGESPPLGWIYRWAVENIAFGEAFRDSTKFFTPLFLFGGILLGQTVSLLIEIKPKLKFLTILTVYTYILFLIHPALLGQLNGVLSTKAFPSSFKVIKENLAADYGFFRTVWFPERHPLAFHTEEKPALDAKDLVNKRPFATLNVGTFDRFNFMRSQASPTNNSEFLDWFDLLGIRYLVFSGNQRVVQLNEEEQESWNKLLELVDGVDGLEKVDWGSDIPVYLNLETMPHIFATDKLVAVVGSDSIYQKLREANPEFSVTNQAFVFFEDGKLEPRDLRGIASESAVLVFNEKEELDLQMSFLQSYFVGSDEASENEWAARETSEYLKWKYEFLVNKQDTKEFDYGKGIAFSTVKGEEISWELDVPQDGDYMLATRIFEDGKFSWDVSEVTLEKGVYPLTLTNDTGFAAVNVVALVPKENWNEARDLVRQFTGHFPVVELDGMDGLDELGEIIEGSEWQEATFAKKSPFRYEITAAQTEWLVFTDSYHPMWKFEKGVELLPSYPFYSAINGFYVQADWRDTRIVFEGQKEVRWGFYYTTVFALFAGIIYLYKKDEKS